MSSGAEEGVAVPTTTLDDPAVEPWPEKETGCRVGAHHHRRRLRCSSSPSAAVLIVAVVCGTVALPFLLFFLAGRENAAIRKLTANGGATTTTARAADELLGGLLPPGMDRRACRSRYESSQYYRHFPYKPSAYLLQKLRAYEVRHKRCGPGTPLYAKAAGRLRSSGSNRTMTTDDGGCRYMVWLPFDGLGNRMLSMLSGFLYALLTDRVLLVALPEDSSDLFCEPFPDATWRVPPDFPVSNLFRLGPHPDQAYTKLLYKKAIVLNSTTPPPPYVFLSIGYDRRIMDKLFFCGEHQVALANVTWILQYSDLYYAPSLYAVPAFRAELRRMFPAALESVGHLLGRYLFHPTNPVWGLVTRFYHSYLSHARRRIGIQVRMFRFVSIPADDMYNQILACSRQEHHMLPEIVNDTAAGDLRNNGSTAIFVASLYADYYERLKSRYYEHATSSAGGVGPVAAVFQATHEERQGTGRLAHNRKALAEVYLLAFSDDLITTAISTFGYVSSCLAGVRPATLLPAFGHKVPATPCVRVTSMEPCNLTPPRVECATAGEKDEDVARHVRVCEDRDQSVKLFD
jgi:xyloglucan fucosyltransferase